MAYRVAQDNDAKHSAIFSSPKENKKYIDEMKEQIKESYVPLDKKRQGEVAEAQAIPGSKDITLTEAVQWFQKGRIHFGSGDYDEAIKCFDNAIELEPNNENFLLFKAHTLMRIKKYEETIECTEKLLELKPNSIDTLMTSADIFFELERYEEAMECGEKALKLNPNDARVFAAILGGIGRTLHAQKRYGEAIQRFDKALEIDRRSIMALIGKGLVNYDLREYDEAIKNFDTALEINKNLIQALINKGAALYTLERYEEAIECYNMFLKVKESDDVYFYRGQAKFALEDYSGALGDFNRVRSGQFGSADKTVSIGQCYYELGFYDDAESNYREAIKSNPKLYKTYYNLAVLYASENKYNRAKKQLETCLKINRNFSEARDAIKKLEGSDQSDWYRWWFGDEDKYKMNKGEGKVMNRKRIKKKNMMAFKPILGMTVMASMALLMVATVVLAFMYPSNLAASVVAALTLLMGILFGVLLLPSLMKFKAAGIELEPAPFVPEPIKLKLQSPLYIFEKPVTRLQL